MNKCDIIFLLLSALLFAACENKDLFPPCDNSGNALIEVIIHWEGKPAGALPQNMRVLWYPQNGSSGMLDKIFNTYGGFDHLPDAQYTPPVDI